MVSYIHSNLKYIQKRLGYDLIARNVVGECAKNIFVSEKFEYETLRAKTRMVI